MYTGKSGTTIDVRTPGEFAGNHVPGAINIPLDEVEKRIKEFNEFPKPIVAYCKSGNRSSVAIDILKQNGITEIINGGGLDEMLKTKIH